jgi:ketosteroid isomerase-like protein
MSQENVETLRGAVEASQRRDVKDVSAMLEILDPDCVYELPAELVPDPESFHGHDAFRRQWSQYMDLWQDGTFSMVTEQYIDAGDRVVLLTRHRGRTKHGMDLDMPVAYVMTFRDAKVVHGRPYMDPAQALEAVGLSEQDAHAES